MDTDKSNIEMLSQKEKIARLIMSGKNEEVIDAWEESPHLINCFMGRRGHYLHIASQYGSDATLVGYLLSHKVSPNVLDQDFETPLHRVSYRLRDETDEAEKIILALSEYGADINAQDVEGNTPLHAFVRRPWADRVGFLVELGPKLNIRNHVGQTALDIVYARRFPQWGQVASWLKSKGGLRGAAAPKLTREKRGS